MEGEQIASDTQEGVKTVKLPFIYSKLVVLLPLTFDTPSVYCPQGSPVSCRRTAAVLSSSTLVAAILHLSYSVSTTVIKRVCETAARECISKGLRRGQ